MAGVRDKCMDQDGIRSRIVEYSKNMKPHWCAKAHYGIVLSGKMEIEFEGEKHIYEKGDCIFIPPGQKHGHKATIISSKVTAFFIEYSNEGLKKKQENL